MSKLVEKVVLNQNPENCPIEELKVYMCPEIFIGEIFDAFIDIEEEPINICIAEIEEDGDDFLIRGHDEEENEVELKLSEVIFWIS
ncbi:hypothetical protein [Alkaliphilus sp. B6464]|uniref:hypothetical protein n=1 Tax=Alkaliphilus sp. B6464 TaxID=2731219 RepID=UPI001BA5BD7B|nr:hypothetical protein [Alkaliphilus sp. B6464]QUH22187.1 hypothetical protein HYG84_19975 [Alkaliphilus sp. B6464]